MTRSATRWARAMRPTLASLALLAAGCGQQTMDDAGAAMEDAARDVEAAAEDATTAAGEAAEDVKASLGEGFSAAAEKASAALAGVEGGGELLKGFQDLFTSAQQSLSGITDKASAEAATADFSKLSSSLDALAKKAELLPADAKAALHGLIEQGVAQIKALAEKALAIPGVKEVVSPKLDELMARFASLTGGAQKP